MKKTLILFALFLSACVVDSEPQSTTQTKKPMANTLCADFKKVKVFQTFDNGALASVCKNGNTDNCYGMTVVIPKKWDLKLWDEKIVTPPEGKCFVYKDTIEYETKGNDTKTVPVLDFDYEYWASSTDEVNARMQADLENTQFECYSDVEEALKKNKKTAKEKQQLKIDGMEWCNCVYESAKTAWNYGKNTTLEEMQQAKDKMNKEMENCNKKHPKAVKLLNGK